MQHTAWTQTQQRKEVSLSLHMLFIYFSDLPFFSKFCWGKRAKGWSTPKSRNVSAKGKSNLFPHGSEFLSLFASVLNLSKRSIRHHQIFPPCHSNSWVSRALIPKLNALLPPPTALLPARQWPSVTPRTCQRKAALPVAEAVSGGQWSPTTCHV